MAKPEIADLKLLKSLTIEADDRKVSNTIELIATKSSLSLPSVVLNILINIELRIPNKALISHGFQIVEINGPLRYYANINLDELNTGNNFSQFKLMYYLNIPMDISNFNLYYTNGNNEYWLLGVCKRNNNIWEYEANDINCSIDLKNEHINYFYVCGSPKSGTTWVENILNGHPELVCLSEGYFWNFSNSFNAEFYTKQDFMKWYPTNLSNEYFRGLMFRAISIERFEYFRQMWNVKAIGDKTPNYINHFRMIRFSVPEAKIILCVRHPLDVAVSRLFHEYNLYLDGKQELCELPNDYFEHLDFSIKIDNKKNGNLFKDFIMIKWFLDSWINENKSINHYLLSDKNAMLVKYEDLVLQPNLIVMRLFELISVDTSESVVSRCLSNSSFMRMSKGRIPGEEDSRSFYRKGVIGDYKNYMSEDQINFAKSYLDIVASDLMQYLGYDI